jgi:gamma-glutamyltranspeptidase/glutathione hydrolase
MTSVAGRFHGRALVLVVALAFWLNGCTTPEAWADSAVGQNGMVVSVSAPASQVGVDILRKGGNAVDAAVATAFALAVTFPEAGNIGGGGFMVVYPGKGGDPAVIDYRETAPAAAEKTMYVQTKSHLGPRIAGVPGTVRGLALAHQKFGKLPWKDVVRPAVRLAEEGFPVDAYLAAGLNRVLARSGEFAEFRRVYGKANGTERWQAGDRLVLKDLAGTLRRLADEGPDAFYQGAVAEQIVAEMKASGGLISRADLAGYRAKVRTPLHGVYRGYEIYCPPAPSGGVCLVEMLNILENFDLRKQGRWAPDTLHLMAEAMRRAYADRARYMADPDFVTIPARLTSKEYARKLADTINLKRATPSAELAGDIPLAPEGDHTTHFSVIDRDGMAVANTYTLEESYGCRVVVRGAGFLLNNEMGDFNWRPGYTDRRGAIGTLPNQIAPGKRMLSSQTPTVVARGGKVVLVTGSPGGRTIINTVLCVVLNVLEFDMDLAAAVAAPRMHQPWFPDKVFFESAMRQEHAAALEQLRRLGHVVDTGERQQGDGHSIWVERGSGSYRGCADDRRHGKAVGY